MKLNVVMVSCVISTLFLTMTISTTSLHHIDIESLTTAMPKEQLFALSQLTEHATISIGADGGFSALGFPGNGSLTNPYLIENLEIFGSSNLECIYVGGSVTAYYEIRECRLSGSYPGDGILLAAGHGLVESCEIFNCTNGISIWSDGHIIDSCEIHNTSHGVHPYLADDVVVQNSLFYDDFVSWFDGVDGLTLKDNTFIESKVAIGESVNIIVKGNVFNIGEFGDHLSIFDSRIATVVQNTFNIDGSTGIRIQGCFDIIIQECDFIGTEPSGTGNFGVNTGGSDYMFDITIEDCLFRSASCDGSFVKDGLSISNCVFTNGCISVTDSTFAEIRNNTINYGRISVGSNCINSTIQDNTLMNCNTSGIRVRRNNTGLVISNNSLNGSRESENNGIDLWSNNVTVRYNSIENFDSGISVLNSNSCIIHNNTISGNNLGIEVGGGCSFHRLYYNSLYGNTRNAMDDGLNNIWDDGVSLGNYWSNLYAPGVYVIPGSAGSVDRYAQPYRPSMPPVLLIIVGAGVVGTAIAFVHLRRR